MKDGFAERLRYGFIPWASQPYWAKVIGFVERLWRSVKSERVFLKAYGRLNAARAGIAEYVSWYNDGRVHSSLNKVTPNKHYFANLPSLKKAA